MPMELQTHRSGTRAEWVVAVAASAGGLQALRTLLGGLPETFPAAILVVQHLEPTRESQLAEILDRDTPLNVTQATARELIRAGNVYIAPPDYHLVVGAHGRIGLTKDAKVRFSRPSADVLFLTVAEKYGDRAIAVVLTGSGTDGAAGAAAIHKAGGIVIAQDEATSTHFSMPGATIERAQPDYVLPLESIALKLIGLMTSHDRN
jgi:two-component system, chemotaxis family, protein-glutamate methylesterase/glutaminase